MSQGGGGGHGHTRTPHAPYLDSANVFTFLRILQSIVSNYQFLRLNSIMC